MAELTVEVGTLSAEAGWNEPALRSTFSRGLMDRARDREIYMIVR